MNYNYILQLAKTDLQISGTAYDNYLLSLVQVAEMAITREGITLGTTEEDNVLVSMYAAYLWRKRRTNDPMPRMLRYMLNNRLFSEKIMAGADSDLVNVGLADYMILQD